MILSYIFTHKSKPLSIHTFVFKFTSKLNYPVLTPY